MCSMNTAIKSAFFHAKQKGDTMAYIVTYKGMIVAGPFIHWQDAEKARAAKAEETGMMRGEFQVTEV